jgi:hypothetical protein
MKMISVSPGPANAHATEHVSVEAAKDVPELI